MWIFICLLVTAWQTAYGFSLESSLSELLHAPLIDPIIDAILQKGVARCYASTGIEPDVATSIDQCNKLRYVQIIRQEYQTSISTTETIASKQIATIPIVDETERSFQDFFESYAVANNPLIIASSNAPLGIPSSRWEAFLSACFLPNVPEATLRTEDRECIPYLSELHVPLFMAQDYLQRTNAGKVSRYAPTVIQVQPQVQQEIGMEDGEILACPHHLHLFILSLAKSDVQIKLFSRSLLPISTLEALLSIHQVDFDASTMQQDSGWKLGNPSGRKPISHDATLSPFELLFVPGDLALSLVTTNSASVLRFCYGDASNIYAVKKALKTDALIDSIANDLLDAFNSLHFDAFMAHRLATNDAAYERFMTWPKETAFVKRSEKEGGRSRRDRLKKWQESKRWERRIESLTLPVALPPLVVEATGATAKIKWQDIYQPHREDTVDFGYVVRIYDHSMESHETSDVVRIASGQLSRSALPTDLFGNDFDGKEIEATMRGLRPGHMYSFSVQVYLEEATGVESRRSKPVKTQVTTLPSKVRGIPNLQATTGSCIKVQWMDAAANSEVIVMYGIALKEASKDGRQHVLTIDSKDTKPGNHGGREGEICGLLVGRKYTVQVAAVGEAGAGPWSLPSDVIHMPSRFSTTHLPPGSIPTIHGIGDPNYIALDGLMHSLWSNPSLPANTRIQDESPAHRVLLSDMKGTLQLSSSDGAKQVLDVWASHYSPKLFQVSAQLILADPPDASSYLRNADAVRDRIVLVERGTVPIVFKVHYAQAAGALGIIIADTEDICKGTFDERCMPGANKSRGEGFAALDQHHLWKSNRIPCVLATKSSWTKLLDLIAR